MSCPFKAQQEAQAQEAPKQCPYHKAQEVAQEEAPKKCPFAGAQDPTSNSDIKTHFRESYDGVATTAAVRGNMERGRLVLATMGYSDADIAVIGDDACNTQGTGCPHVFAKAQPGETVLDLGSGLGIDAFVAATHVGPAGKVIGLDLSEGEVRHANERRDARGLTNVEFVAGDMEAMPLPDSSVDVVISNGGFCLTPDKPKAFREICRVLKPGGRMAVCCTTLKGALPEGVDWPICFKVFMRLDHAQQIISDAGLAEVAIDTTNAEVVFEEPKPEDVPAEAPMCKYAKAAAERRAKEEAGEIPSKTGRVGVHRNDPRFDHLKGHNMNDLCARITAVARKPLA